MISYDFIVENFEALEADFQREYGIDLPDALWGEKPIGVRRLSALITGLSPGCATFRKLRQGGVTEERRDRQPEPAMSSKGAQIDFFAASEVGITVWDPGGSDADVR